MSAGKPFLSRVLLDRALNLSVPVDTSIGHASLDPGCRRVHGRSHWETMGVLAVASCAKSGPGMPIPGSFAPWQHTTTNARNPNPYAGGICLPVPPETRRCLASVLEASDCLFLEPQCQRIKALSLSALMRSGAIFCTDHFDLVAFDKCSDWDKIRP